VVPHFPPRFLGYTHCGPEAFITSLGRLVTDPKEVRRWHRLEGWGFLPLYVYKVIVGILDPREAPARALYRIALLVLLPGLSDHFPGDYEERLRVLLKKSAEGDGQKWLPPGFEPETRGQGERQEGKGLPSV
jgi:hypothetical protein